MEVFTDGVTVDPGPAGANQNWTIPAYTWADSTYSEIVDPAATVFAEHFPTATRALYHTESQNGGPLVQVYAFDRIAADGWYMVGMGMQMDTVLIPIPFVPEVRQVPLPLTFGASWTTVSRAEAGGQVWIDSTLISIDGWGTLNTPYGTHSVLRAFLHSYSITSGPNGEEVVEGASYAWMDDRGLIVADIESIEDSGNPNFTVGNVKLGRHVTAGARTPERGPVAATFAVDQNYPNPFNPTTVLPVELQQTARVTLDIYDATGRLVARELHELPAGRHSLPVDGSAWAAGTYFAKITAGGVAQTTKMQLVK